MNSDSKPRPRRRSSFDKFKDWIRQPFTKDRSFPPISLPVPANQMEIKPGYNTLCRLNKRKQGNATRKQEKQGGKAQHISTHDFLETGRNGPTPHASYGRHEPLPSSSRAPRDRRYSASDSPPAPPSKPVSRAQVHDENRYPRKPVAKPRRRSTAGVSHPPGPNTTSFVPPELTRPGKVVRVGDVSCGQPHHVPSTRSAVHSIHAEIGTSSSRSRSRSSSYDSDFSNFSDFPRVPNNPPVLRKQSVMKTPLGLYSRFSKQSLEHVGLQICLKCDVRAQNPRTGLCDSCENLHKMPLCSRCRKRAPGELGICRSCMEDIDVAPCRVCRNPEARYSSGLCADCELLGQGRPATVVNASRTSSHAPPLPISSEPFPTYFSSADARGLYDPLHPDFFSPSAQDFEVCPPSPPLKDPAYLDNNPHLASRPGHGVPHADPWGTLHRYQHDSAMPAPLQLRRRLSDIHPAERDDFCVSPISPHSQAKFDAFAGASRWSMSSADDDEEPRGRTRTRSPIRVAKLGGHKKMLSSAELDPKMSVTTLVSQPSQPQHVKFARPHWRP